MTLHSVLDGVIATLHAIPAIVVDRAIVFPAVMPAELEALTASTGVRFPPWIVQLYSEIGGAHISWRLGASGYQALDPGRPDNSYRYDISGNLDLLSPGDACRSLTGHRWHQVYEKPPNGDFPIDFASFFLNARCAVDTFPDHDGPVLYILYDGRMIPLDMTLTEYLQRGSEWLFMSEWQLTLTSIEEYADVANHLKRVKAQLFAPGAI